MLECISSLHHTGEPLQIKSLTNTGLCARFKLTDVLATPDFEAFHGRMPLALDVEPSTCTQVSRFRACLFSEDYVSHALVVDLGVRISSVCPSSVAPSADNTWLFCGPRDCCLQDYQRRESHVDAASVDRTSYLRDPVPPESSRVGSQEAPSVTERMSHRRRLKSAHCATLRHGKGERHQHTGHNPRP